MSARWPWSALGLEGPATEREVKRAYAARLKQIDRSDPDAFGALRNALDAAKGRAKKAGAKRPRMAEIAHGTHDAGPQEPEPARPVAPRDAAPPEPPKPEPEVTAAPLDLPEPPAVVPKEPRAKRAQPPVPPKPKAQPWGAATASLDTLLQDDPIAAEDAFWTKLHKATKIWPWDVATLDKLLSLDLAHDIARRRDIEHQLYDRLLASITMPESGYAQSVATLIERQFGWAADGVGLRRRLGYKPSFEVMMHGHALSLPKTERSRTARVTDATHKWAWYKAGVFLLLWLVSLRGQRVSSTEDLLIQLIAVGIFLWFLTWITRGLVIALQWMGRITRLSGPARTAFAKLFPETERALDRNAQARRFAMFVFSALLAGLVFLAS